MLCQFLLYSKVIVLYIYIFFFLFFSMMVYHRILNAAPCALQQDLAVNAFIVSLLVVNCPTITWTHPSSFISSRGDWEGRALTLRGRRSSSMARSLFVAGTFPHPAPHPHLTPYLYPLPWRPQLKTFLGKPSRTACPVRSL